MLAKTHEALIAKAQEASRNKHACSHVSAAHARLIEAVINNPPPAFDLHPNEDQFEDAKYYLTKLAAAMDEAVYQVMSEAASNAYTKISSADPSIVTNALHDADVFADLNIAAQDIRAGAAA